MTTTEKTQIEEIKLFWNGDTMELTDEEGNKAVLGLWYDTYGEYHDAFDFHAVVYDQETHLAEVESAVDAKVDEVTNDYEIELDEVRNAYQAKLATLVEAIDLAALPVEARRIAEDVLTELRFATVAA